MIKYRGDDINRILFRNKDISIPYYKENLIGLLDFKGFNGRNKRICYNLLNANHKMIFSDNIKTDCIKDCIKLSDNSVNGDVSYVNIDNFSNLMLDDSAVFTIEMDLFIPDVTSSTNTIPCLLFGEKSYMIVQLANNRIKFFCKTPQNDLSPDNHVEINKNIFNDIKNKFITVSFTLDQSVKKLKMYIDGVLVSVGEDLNSTLSDNTTGYSNKIGFGNIAGWRSNCNIYSLRVYNRILTTDIMKSNHDIFINRFDTACVPDGLMLDVRAEDKIWEDGDKLFIKDHSPSKNNMYCPQYSPVKQSTLNKYFHFNRQINHDEHFSSTGRYVLPKKSFTIETMFSIDFRDGYNGILGYNQYKEYGFMLIHNKDYIFIAFSTTTNETLYYSVHAFEPYKKYHMSIRYDHDASLIKTIINGETRDIKIRDYNPNRILDFKIGSCYQYSSFRGRINFCRVYNRLLSEDELKVNADKDIQKYLHLNIPTERLICDFDGRKPPVKTENPLVQRWVDSQNSNIYCECDAQNGNTFTWHRDEFAYEFTGNNNGKCVINSNNPVFTVAMYTKVVDSDISNKWRMVFNTSNLGYIGSLIKIANNGVGKFSTSGDIIQTEDVRIDQYNHICMVFDTETMTKKLYLNGRLQGQTKITSVDSINMEWFAHGYIDSGETLQNCRHRKTSIYAKELTEDEVLDHYNFCKYVLDNNEYSCNNKLLINIDAHDKPFYKDDRYLFHNRVDSNASGYMITPEDTEVYDTSSISIKTDIDISSSSLVVPDTNLSNSLLREFSISIRYKATNSNNTSGTCILSKGDSNNRFTIYAENGSLCVEMFGTATKTVVPDFVVQNNTMYNIDLTFKNGNCAIYVDGVLKIKWTIENNIFASGDFVLLGSNSDSPYRSDASINIFRVYSVELKPYQVQYNFNKDIERFLWLERSLFSVPNNDTNNNYNEYFIDSLDTIYLHYNSDITTIVIPDDADIKCINIAGCSSLKSIRRVSEPNLGQFDLSDFVLDTLNISECENLTSIKNITLSSDTIPINFLRGVAIEDVSELFADDYKNRIRHIGNNFMNNCNNLKSIKGLFKDCTSLETLGKAFMYGCESLTDVSYTFSGCTSLRYIPELLFAFSPLENASYLFENCSSMRCHLDNKFLLETYSIRDISYMYSGCSSLIGDHINYDKWRYTDMTHTKLSRTRGCYSNCTSLNDYDFISSFIK